MLFHPNPASPRVSPHQLQLPAQSLCITHPQYALALLGRLTFFTRCCALPSSNPSSQHTDLVLHIQHHRTRILVTITTMDLRVWHEYHVGRKIGSGNLGDIYLGTNIISGEEVAIKLESVKAKHPQLKYEARVIKAVAGGVGIPSCTGSVPNVTTISWSLVCLVPVWKICSTFATASSP